MKNADMPAMMVPLNPGEKSIYGCPPDGLTKREHFASLVMQSLAIGGLDPFYTAPRAIEYADALLAALEENNQ